MTRDSLRGQAIRYLIIGGLNTLVSYAVFIGLGLFIPAGVAYTIAYVIGLAWVVFGSSRFVFGGGHSARRLILFTGWYLLVYAAGQLVVQLIAPADFVSLLITSGIILLVTTPLSFIGGRYIFRPPAPDPEATKG